MSMGVTLLLMGFEALTSQGQNLKSLIKRDAADIEEQIHIKMTDCCQNNKVDTLLSCRNKKKGDFSVI